MKSIFPIVIVTLAAIVVSNDGLAQGHPDASGEASIKIYRSSEYQTESKEFEKSVPVVLEYNSDACEADLHLEYFQAGPDANVKTTLINEACGASSGNYTIRIRFKDANGDMGLIEFEEAWNRDDDATLTSEKNYFVGEGLDITRVNSRRLSCSCKEPERLEEE